MELGRDPACSLPLDLPTVSWRHAALERTAEGIIVEDLGSRNGTYVDGCGSRKDTAAAGPGDRAGQLPFSAAGDGALAKREYIGNVTIEVASVAVCAANGVRLLDAISLTIFPSELVALMGRLEPARRLF